MKYVLKRETNIMDSVIIFIFTEVMTCKKIPGVLIEAEII